jgi:hypothetical protein
MKKRMGIFLTGAAIAAFSFLTPPLGGQEPGAGPPAASPLRYEIWVELDDVNKTLQGKEDLVWTNTGSEPVSDMLFHLYWNAFKNEASTFFQEVGQEGLFARGSLPEDGDWGWIDVTGIRTADGRDLAASRSFVTRDKPVHPGDETVMRIEFPEPVEPGEEVRLSLEFQSKIPRTVARSGYYRNSYFIAQWFPKPGVYEEGKGWNAHEYHQNSEFFADFADFAVHITVPEGFVVGASGKETDVLHDQAERKATHTYRQARIHDFAWIADPRYLKIERDFVADEEVSPEEYAETAGLLGLSVEEVKLPDVKMTLLIAPEHRKQIDRHFKALRAAIKYYGLWYGPYPYETVTMVDPPFRTGSGGMEYPTLFTAGTSVLPSSEVLSPEGVIVHEFGHGYWYGLVANNEFEEAWLDEGLNTYSTGRVVAKAYGSGAAPFKFKGLPFPRFLKMPQYLDAEMDRAAAINIAEFDPVVTPSWGFYNTGSYAANVYMRASTLLNTLERLLGEPTWARIMRTYHMNYRFRHPSTEDFIGIVNQISGQDLGWFFDELLFGTRNFDYGIASLTSVEKPASLLGVFDSDSGREEVTREKARDLAQDDRAPVGGEGDGKDYLSTVVLRRYGEARIGGEARIKLRMVFDDGSVETRFWDGRDRWVKMTFTKPARARSARIDPETIWLIDSNFANNSRTAAPIRRNLVRIAGRILFWFQTILQTVSSFS